MAFEDFQTYVIYGAVAIALIYILKSKYPTHFSKIFPTQTQKYIKKKAKVDAEIKELDSLKDLKVSEEMLALKKKELGLN